MDLSSLKIKSFNVSYTFKQNGDHFISVGFEVPESISAEEFEIEHLKASHLVTKSAIYAALGRGAIDIHVANSHISTAQENFERLLEKKTKTDVKLASDSP